MPVLSGNSLILGKPVGSLPESLGPLSRLKPYLIKEVAGFRIAIIGLTTPALTTWLPPEYLRGYEALDPVESLRGLLKEVTAQHKPDAILVAGHMGLIRRDDNANRVGALTQEFPQLVAFIGGHTHQNHSSEMSNGVLYTQADHYGIYVGKVDLVFDRTSRRLLKREAVTVHMDGQIPLDPLVLSLAQHDLDDAKEVLHRPVGELTEPFAISSLPGEPSEVERLIASGILAGMQKQNVEVDAVIHGLFDRDHPFLAGPKTVGDIWRILPYENQIVTVELSREDLTAFVQDFLSKRDYRNVMGLRAMGEIDGASYRLSELRMADGSPLVSKPVYRVALNSYDSQSGGQRFPLAARLVAAPGNRRVLHALQVRDAMIDFFLARQKVSKSTLLV